MALIIVVFAIALASMIVVSVTDSTYVAGRVQTSYEQRFKAEYLLKSTLNFARVLIQATSKPNLPDPPREGWGAFVNGVEVPLGMLGVNEPGVTISLEIGGEDSKLPLSALSKPTSSQTWAPRFTQLFRNFGFDNDQQADQTGLFGKRVFNAEEVVANIIDYVDGDTTGAVVGNATGVDADVPSDYFPNDPNTGILSADELRLIPGLTPQRINQILPHISFFAPPSGRVNFNLASRSVLQALFPQANAGLIEQLYQVARGPEGPLASSDPRLAALTGSGSGSVSLSSNTTWYSVIAKVQFGSNRYFLRSYLKSESPPNYPAIHGIELYG